MDRFILIFQKFVLVILIALGLAIMVASGYFFFWYIPKLQTDIFNAIILRAILISIVYAYFRLLKWSYEEMRKIRNEQNNMDRPNNHRPEEPAVIPERNEQSRTNGHAGKHNGEPIDTGTDGQEIKHE